MLVGGRCPRPISAATTPASARLAREVTSTTRPVTRSFSITVLARRFQGWNSAAKLRKVENDAAAMPAAAPAARCSASMVNSSGTMPRNTTPVPIMARRGGRRANSTQPATIDSGMARRTSRLPCGGRHVVEQDVVGHLDADDAEPDQPALRRQHDAQRIRPEAGHGEQHHRRHEHGVEDEGDRVGADLLAEHVGDAEHGDGKTYR